MWLDYALTFLFALCAVLGTILLVELALWLARGRDRGPFFVLLCLVATAALASGCGERVEGGLLLMAVSLACSMGVILRLFRGEGR